MDWLTLHEKMNCSAEAKKLSQVRILAQQPV